METVDSLTNEKKTSFKDVVFRLFRNVKSSILSHKYLVFAFFAPILILFTCYLFVGMLLKNGTSILVLDANAQYVRFFEQLWSVLRGKESLIYTFERALGGEFFGYYAYYLASPLSLIIALFPKNMIIEAMTLIALLKAGFCGLSFSFFLYKTRPVNSIGFGMFSVMYALCAYAIAYQSNYMWMDALIWLPLITLGIVSMIKENKFKLYIISLAIGICSNYYIGFMLCIFTLIYFTFFMLSHSKNERNIRNEKLHTSKSIIRYSLYTAVSLMISSSMIFVAAYSLSFGKLGAFDGTALIPEVRANFLEIISKLFIGNFGTFRPEPQGLPHLYAGTLLVILLPAFFAIKKIKLREKIGYGILSAVFVASLSISTLDLVWHGLSEPIWLSYRYSFIFTFIMLTMAYRAYEGIKDLKFKYFAIVSGAIVGILFILQMTVHPVQYVDGEKTETNLGLFTVWITILLLCGYLVVFYFLKKKPHRTRLFSLILCGTVCAEALLASCLCYKDQFIDSGWTSRSTYYSVQKNADIVSDFFESYDDGLYRAESYSHVETNDPIIFNTNGVSEFVSTFNAKAKDFLYCLGFNAKAQSSLYSYDDNYIQPVSRFLNDSFLGIKYIYLSSEEDKPDKFDDYYEKIAELENGYIIYENKYALSFAYAVNDRVKEVNFDSALEFFGYDDKSELHSDRSAFNKYLVGSMTEKGSISFISAQNVKTVLEELKEGELLVSEHSDTYIKGTITAKESQFVFTTIPYDKMWKVYVDGERVDTFMCVDSMLAFDIDEGEHTVELRYEPMQFYVGLLITALGILTFSVFCLFEARRKTKKGKEEL